MNLRLPELLAARLARPLPGPMMGSRVEPTPRYGRRYDDPPPDARQAAVLVLLYPHAGHWHVPLTLRPAHLPDHPGQISLPGGAVGPGETGRDAALREFYEELGAVGHVIRVLGALSPIYVHASNFRVEPHVAATDHRPPMAPNPAEVDELLEVPLGWLLDPAHLGCHQREHEGRPYMAPHFQWNERRIWGATCMILGEFVTVVESLGLAADEV